MPGTADDLYLEWLYSQIAPLKTKSRRESHWELARQLYMTRFYWSVRHDKNRAEDGQTLRDEYLRQTGDPEPHDNWMEMDCSVLEMLVALSDRVAFESYGTIGDWFFKLMENVGLDRYVDYRYNAHVRHEVDMTIHRVLDREYAEDGTGGFFPLRLAERDQRKIELWYQKEAYLLEGLRVNNGPETDEI